MRTRAIAGVVVAVLLATGPALADAPCPPKDIFSPIPDAEDLTFETADLSTAGVPLAWQMGVMGQAHYRLFPDGSGSIGEDYKMSGWRLDFICDADSKGCQFTGVQNPPSSAMEAAKKIGACLMSKPSAPSPKTADAVKPAEPKSVAPQSGTPAAGGPKLPAAEPAKPASVAPADTVMPPGPAGTVNHSLTQAESKKQNLPDAGIPSPIVQAPVAPTSAPTILPAAKNSTPKHGDEKKSANSASPPSLSVVPSAAAKTVSAAEQSAQTGLAGPVFPPESKIAVAPTTANGPPPIAGGLTVSNQQPPLRHGLGRLAAFGPRVPKAAVQIVLPAPPSRWPNTSVGIEARAFPGRKTRASIAPQKAQCWVVNLPNDGPLATVQRLLLLAGYDAGPVDGKNGLHTSRAEQNAFGEGASRLPVNEIIARLQARLCDDRVQP